MPRRRSPEKRKILPDPKYKDIIVAKNISSSAKAKEVDVYNISNQDMGLDIGTKTIKEFLDVLQKAKLVIWNGPLGAFEYEKFSNGTKLIAEEIKTLTIKGSLKSIIGGGDTASAIMNLKLENYFTHVSTGGGASLELLSGKNIKLKENFKKDWYEKILYCKLENELNY